MPFPRVIIADTDADYISRLQNKFTEAFFGRIELEIVSDTAYFSELFSTPQDADVLVISEGLYSPELQRHSIGNVFLLTEQQDALPAGGNVMCIQKYSSISGILSEVISRCPSLQTKVRKKDCQIVLVSSACGGVGKTTAALGICGCLAAEYKRVLYVNAGRLQSFQRVMQDKSPIAAAEVYAGLAHPSERIYEQIKHVIRTEGFSYLPPFRAPLLSLDLPFSVYEKIVLSAKASRDFDYIVVDADAVLDEDCAALLGDADKVVIVTRQTAPAVYATDVLVSSLDRVEKDKYIFVCGDFRSRESSALGAQSGTRRFSVSEYVEHFENYDSLGCGQYMKSAGIRETAMLVM